MVSDGTGWVSTNATVHVSTVTTPSTRHTAITRDATVPFCHWSQTSNTRPLISEVYHRLALFATWLSLTFALASLLPAQSHTFYVSRPNCRLWTKHTENPFDYSHYYRQPAIAWDAEAAVTSLATGVLLKQIGAPLWVAGALPTIGFGLVPHLVGWRMGKYQIDVAHWLFVAVNRATPAVWAVAHKDDTAGVVWKHHLTATATWLAADLSLSCFDR